MFFKKKKKQIVYLRVVPVLFNQHGFNYVLQCADSEDMIWKDVNSYCLEYEAQDALRQLCAKYSCFVRF